MITTTPVRNANSKYRLFGAKGSGSAAVEFLLGELGVEHEVLDAAPWTDPPGPAFAELQGISKYAQLPTLMAPGGEVLTESVAILWSLLERHPSGWVPVADRRARAACLRWMTFIAGNVYSAIGIVDYPERWLAEPSQHEPLRAGAKGRIALAWRTLADQWQGTPYFLGAAPTILDVYAANISRWSGARAALRATHPQVLALLERVEASPDVAGVWARHWPSS